MANLAGRSWLKGNPWSNGQVQAVEEWSTRVGDQFPGDVVAPRNTLRGHPQPWRTRPAHALDDEGPLHYSVKPKNGGDYTLCRGGAATGAPQIIKPPPTDLAATTSTAAIAPNEWEARLGNAKTSCGLRGSIAPNWTPRRQEDLTQTGGVGTAGWKDGTNKFIYPGTVTLDQLRVGIDDKPTGATWSTASLARNEWEDRLDDAKMGTPL